LSDPGRFVHRFDGRAQSYSRHRPTYPIQALNVLAREGGLRPTGAVADVGSGTGILSELLLQHGNLVYCVEPNLEMREEAERRLGKFGRRFISVDGSAEDTSLPSECVGLVTVGQALHWFDRAKASREFRRILKPGGRMAVVYNNRRRTNGTGRAYDSIVKRFESRAMVPQVDDAFIRGFLGKGSKRFTAHNAQVLDRAGVLGRLASASYMPLRGSKEGDGVRAAVDEVFRRYGRSGMVELPYQTTIHISAPVNHSV
jgi:SAM-dependent methyltransferase